MSRRALILLALAALALPAVALADVPGRVTIVAIFDPVTYGENAYVNGQLLGDGQGGQLVTLEQSAPPFTEWAPVAQATADYAGYYSFKLHPAQTMQYRTASQGVPSERQVQVNVKPRMKLKAVAAGRKAVRFSGTFAPGLDGQSVAIQRRAASGGWTTVVNAKLHGGKVFQGRLRATRTVMLRAFFASDGAHLDGFSNAVRVVPGAARSATAAACRAPRITRVSFKPSPPVAGSGATMRVTAELSRGRIYAIDAFWGEDRQRDHFTLAPANRNPKVVFALRHRYEKAGRYQVDVKVYARSRLCRSHAVKTVPLTVAEQQ
jgi:hypothetical protein